MLLKLISVTNCHVSNCFGFWIENNLATHRIVSQLGQNYSCRWVGRKFVIGFRNSFPVGAKLVFFGGLRFLSPLRVVVLGSLQIETVFYVMLQYRKI